MGRRPYVLVIPVVTALTLILAFVWNGFGYTNASEILYVFGNTDSSVNVSYQQTTPEHAYRSKVNSAIIKIGDLSTSVSQTSRDLIEGRIKVAEAAEQIEEAGLQSKQIYSEIQSISGVPDRYLEPLKQLLLSMDAMQKSIDLLQVSLERLDGAGISYGHQTLWLLNSPDSVYLGTMKLMHKDQDALSQVDAAKASFRESQTHSQAMVKGFDRFMDLSNRDFGTMNHKFFLNAMSELVVDESCWC